MESSAPLLSPPPTHPSTRARRSRANSDASSGGSRAPPGPFESHQQQQHPPPSLDVPSPNLSRSASESLDPPPSEQLHLEQDAEAATLPADDNDNIPLPEAPGKDASVSQILQQLEDIDLAAFLTRQTREFAEARIQDPAVSKSKRQAPQWQTPQDLQPWERSAWLSQFEGWLRRVSEQLPPDMVTDFDPDDNDPARFSVRRVRAGAERLYMLVPPSRVTSLRSSARDVAYWRKPRTTALLLMVYCVALAKDLCPALIFTAVILVIVKRRLFPPNASKLRDEVVERRKLAKEAKQIGADFETRGQLTTFGSFLASTSSAATEGARDKATSPTSASSSPLSAKLRAGANAHSKRNTITLAKELGARFGPDAQVMMEDAANIGEKVRNLALFRDPAASWRILALWSVIAVALFFAPAATLPRATFAGLGLHFFCFAYLRHRFPRYRRFFNPVHWALLGLPTDADAARLILQRRAASGQTVKTLRDFKHAEKREFRHAQEKFEMPKFDKDLSRTDNFKIFGASFFNESKRRFGQAKEVLNSYSFDKDSDHAVGTSFFCFQGRSPGRIVLEENHLRFDGIKGFNSSRDRTSESSKTSTDDTPATPSTPDPTRSRLSRLAFRDITSVKKASSFGDPYQLLISCVEGKTYKLSQVADRGEAFLKILLKCPQRVRVKTFAVDDVDEKQV